MKIFNKKDEKSNVQILAEMIKNAATAVDMSCKIILEILEQEKESMDVI